MESSDMPASMNELLKVVPIMIAAGVVMKMVAQITSDDDKGHLTGCIVDVWTERTSTLARILKDEYTASFKTDWPEGYKYLEDNGFSGEAYETLAGKLQVYMNRKGG